MASAALQSARFLNQLYPIRGELFTAQHPWLPRAIDLLRRIAQEQGGEMYAPPGRCNMKRLQILMGRGRKLTIAITIYAQSIYNEGLEDGRRMECER